MGSNDLLMIFVKNPVLGKVKTRLASTVGAENALTIYLKLLEHTESVVTPIEANKAIFYSDEIQEFDQFNELKYKKYLQKGEELGEKMQHAFRLAFSKEYNKVLIIGSDCYQISTQIIEDAFQSLDEKDMVIGPAEDGGYYLLGMKSFHPKFFTDKRWSTENVMLDTLLDIKNMGLSYHLLPTLSDVDYEEDLGDLKKLIE
jgi:rSAM/selenodomain-associated transferase 1